MNRSIALFRSTLILVGALAMTGNSQAESVRLGGDTTKILAISYEATLPEGIDFRKPGNPTFISEIKGISGLEAWGRWTDANLNPTVEIKFNKQLPKKFNLQLEASAFGPNSNVPTTIRVGKVRKTLIVSGPNPQSYILEFAGAKSDILEIIPPKPTAPNDLDSANGDKRKLGLGLVTLKLMPM